MDLFLFIYLLIHSKYCCPENSQFKRYDSITNLNFFLDLAVYMSNKLVLLAANYHNHNYFCFELNVEDGFWKTANPPQNWRVHMITIGHQTGK